MKRRHSYVVKIVFDVLRCSHISLDPVSAFMKRDVFYSFITVNISSLISNIHSFKTPLNPLGVFYCGGDLFEHDFWLKSC